MKGQLKYDSSKVVSYGVCQTTAIVMPEMTPRGYNYPKEARRMGWQQTRKRGWVCPTHAEGGER